MNHKHALLSRGNDNVAGQYSSLSSSPFSEVVGPSLDSDTALLLKMGYTQELNRGFSACMNFSFAFTAVSVIASLTVGLGAALQTGGPAVMMWSWIIASIATTFVGLSMAEICSTYPSAGSVYHWAGMMGSSSSTAWSYVDGWFNFLGNAAGDASFAYGFANVVASMVDLADLESSRSTMSNLNSQQAAFQNLVTTYNQHPSAVSIEIQVAIAVATVFLWAIKNVAKVDAQGWISNFAATLQLLSAPLFIVVLFSVTSSSTWAPMTWVFGDFEDYVGFPSNHQPPYSCVTGNFNDVAYLSVIGLLNALFAFSGYEGGAHMSEETIGASLAAPRALLLTVIGTAISGFVFLIALLFNMYTPSLSYFISDQSPFSNPVVGVLYTTCGYYGGMILSGLLAGNLFFAGFSSLTVTTRIGYAMARDGALPYSSVLRVVEPNTRTPLNMCAFVGILDAAFTTFPLLTQNTPNPELAFTAVTAVTVIGCQISYAIPIAMRASSRLRGGAPFVQGAFNLGRFGAPVAAFASSWLILTSFIFIAPTEWPVDPYTFNYTVVVVFAVIVIAALNWLVSARFTFRGPKSEHGHGGHGHDGVEDIDIGVSF